MSQPNFYRRYNFSIEPGQIFERDVFAAYIAFFSFSDEDGAANVDIRFNGGEFNRVTPSTRFDFTETLVTPTASDASGTFVNKIGLRNNGDKTVTGAFATSMGRITDSILAFGDDTAGSGIPTRVVGTVDAEVAIKKGQLFPVADLATMDDSGIVLNSEQTLLIYPSRIGSPTEPRRFDIFTQTTFNYTGVTIGELYAFDFERIESSAAWWGKAGVPDTGVNSDYTLELILDVRCFVYNGAGETQKRGYRRGGIYQNWRGEFTQNNYGNLQETSSPWYSMTGGTDSGNYAGGERFFQSQIETRPFLFKATATTVSLQFFTSGTLDWSMIYGNVVAPDLSSGAIRIRTSLQPVDPDALGEAA